MDNSAEKIEEEDDADLSLGEDIDDVKVDEDAIEQAEAAASEANSEGSSENEEGSTEEASAESSSEETSEAAENTAEESSSENNTTEDEEPKTTWKEIVRGLPIPNEGKVFICETDQQSTEFLKEILITAEIHYSHINTFTNTKKLSETLMDCDPNDVFLVIMGIEPNDPAPFIFLQKARAERLLDTIPFILNCDFLDHEDAFLLSELNIDSCDSRQGDYDKFVDVLQECLTRRTRYEEMLPFIVRLQANIAEGKIDEARQCIEEGQLAQKLENDPAFIHVLGEFHISTKDYNTAVKLLSTFLRDSNAHHKETLASLNTLGKAYCLAGKFNNALEIYERLAKKSPKNLGHQNMMGDALLGMDDVDGAKEKFQNVLDNDPDNKDALVGMGKAHMADGEAAKAKSFFDKINTPFESYSLASFFNNRGVALVRAGNSEEAISFYQNALQFLDRFKGYVYFNLGLAYYKMGNPSLAKQCFREALKVQDTAFIERKGVLRKLKEEEGIPVDGTNNLPP